MGYTRRFPWMFPDVLASLSREHPADGTVPPLPSAILSEAERELRDNPPVIHTTAFGTRYVTCPDFPGVCAEAPGRCRQSLALEAEYQREKRADLLLDAQRETDGDDA